MSQDPTQPLGGRTAPSSYDPPEPVQPPPIAPAPPGVPHLRARTSSLAATSLILGILGFLSCGLTGLVGLIFGIAALVAINRHAGQLRGQGIAVAGLVLSAVSLVSLVFYGLLAAIALPTFALTAEEALLDESTNRLHAVASFTEDYWNAHDGALPPVHDWVAAVQLEGRLLAYPDDPQELCVFAMNSELDGRYVEELTDAANTVLFFESAPGAKLAGGPELLPAEPRYWQGYLVVYANGDLGLIPPRDLPTLIWEP